MSEQKCVLSASCCGCSLRSGSLAIGIIGLIFSILDMIYGIYMGTKGDKEGWVKMIINLIWVILCIVLIQGIRKEHRGMIMVWVWVSGILIAIKTILVVIIIILTLNIVLAIITFIVMGLAIYCVLVVRSYALSLGSPSNMA